MQDYKFNHSYFSQSANKNTSFFQKRYPFLNYSFRSPPFFLWFPVGTDSKTASRWKPSELMLPFLVSINRKPPEEVRAAYIRYHLVGTPLL